MQHSIRRRREREQIRIHTPFNRKAGHGTPGIRIAAEDGGPRVRLRSGQGGGEAKQDLRGWGHIVLHQRPEVTAYPVGMRSFCRGVAASIGEMIFAGVDPHVDSTEFVVLQLIRGNIGQRIVMGTNAIDFGQRALEVVGVVDGFTAGRAGELFQAQLLFCIAAEFIRFGLRDAVRGTGYAAAVRRSGGQGCRKKTAGVNGIEGNAALASRRAVWSTLKEKSRAAC